MADTPIKEGNVVRLKSGGPQMTVQTVAGNGAVCQWFDEHRNLKEGVFILGTLELVTGEESAAAGFFPG